MFVLHSYVIAVAFCLISMLCWGSWANTQKMTDHRWRFELFYWDYVLGVVVLSTVAAFTLGSMGIEGRSFIEDVRQSGANRILFGPFLGGVIFNAGNILLVAAIHIAGMAVAFPVGVGLSLVLGVVLNYLAAPTGNPTLLFGGVAFVALAIVLDSVAYRRLPSETKSVPIKGLIMSVFVGFLLAYSYRFTAGSMSTDLVHLEKGKLGPYSALFFMSMGLLASNVIFSPLIAKKPFVGEPLRLSEYFKGNLRDHFLGIFGGIIWGVGMLFNLIASGQAGFPISYGLGQGATMVAAIWGVFIWKEFKQAPRGTNLLISLMFFTYVAGLGLVIMAKLR